MFPLLSALVHLIRTCILNLNLLLFQHFQIASSSDCSHLLLYATALWSCVLKSSVLGVFIECVRVCKLTAVSDTSNKNNKVSL